MKISAKREYLTLISLTVITPAVIFFVAPLRIVIGFVYALLVPGYLITTVLFPKAGNPNGLTRLSFSIGFSILIVPLAGLLLNFLPWGIKLVPMMILLAVINAVLLALGWFVRQKLPEEQRFQLALPDIKKGIKTFKKTDGLHKAVVLTGFLLIAVLLFIAFSPAGGNGFTEFYITGISGTAAGYPEKLQTGEAGCVNLTIISHEKETTVYRVEIRVDGKQIQSIKDISVDPLGKWDKYVSFTAEKPNNNAKVEFLLYKDGQNTTPYRQLSLQINVYSGS